MPGVGNLPRCSALVAKAQPDAMTKSVFSDLDSNVVSQKLTFEPVERAWMLCILCLCMHVVHVCFMYGM